MHILLDLQGAQTGSRHRGIGRYATAIAKGIVRKRGDHRVTVLLNGAFEDSVSQIKHDFAQLIPPEEFVVFFGPTPVEGLIPQNAFRKEASEYIRDFAISNISPDAVVVTSLFEGGIDDGVTAISCLDHKTPVATILYDLIPLADPEKYLPGGIQNLWYYDKIANLKKSNLLLAISDSAKQEAVDLLGISSDKINTIYSAADERFVSSTLDESSRRNFARRIGLKRKFIMHASAFEPRKNFEGLVRAFALLSREIKTEYQLVFAAAISPEDQFRVRKLADDFGLGPEDLVYAGHVSDRELIHLYSTCSLFAFPSFHEGFGLPALEAMSCGAVVVASNTTSLPEVVGYQDALFDPFSDADVARVITRALTDHTFRKRLSAHLATQAKTFSWDRSASLALEAITSKIGRRGDHTGQVKIPTLIKKITSSETIGMATRRDLMLIASSISKTEMSLIEWRKLEYGGRDSGGAASIDESINYVESSFGEYKKAVPWLGFDITTLRSNSKLLSRTPSILLLKLDHIGDFVITLTAFRIIRQQWPKAHITLVCGPWNKTLAERTGIFDSVISCEVFAEAGVDYDREEMTQLGLKRFKALNLGVFDLAVDLRYYGDSRILLMHAEAKIRAGYISENVQLDLSLPEIPETGIKLHVGARAVALASAVVWTFGTPAGENASALLAGRAPIRQFTSGTIVGISTGTGNPIKAWGASRFAAFVELMQTRGDYRFVMLGGHRDRADSQAVCSLLPGDRFVDLTGTSSIDDLSPILAGLDLFIGNDTGTTHMAAALGIPTVCMFSGQSHVHSWAPLGPHVVTLRIDVDCSPCYLTKKELCPHGHRCMDIPVDVVVTEAINLRESVGRSLSELSQEEFGSRLALLDGSLRTNSKPGRKSKQEVSEAQ